MERLISLPFCGKTSTEMKLNLNDWNSVEPGSFDLSRVAITIHKFSSDRFLSTICHRELIYWFTNMRLLDSCKWISWEIDCSCDDEKLKGVFLSSVELSGIELNDFSMWNFTILSIDLFTFAAKLKLYIWQLFHHKMPTKE